MYESRDLHSSLQTEVLGSIQGAGADFVMTRLRWSKEDTRYSLHVRPNSFSMSGLQLTDLLAMLDFKRTECVFQYGDGYCRWIEPDFDLTGFATTIGEAHRSLTEAERSLNACGIYLPQPEGWGYYNGRQSMNRKSPTTTYGDGHTSPKTRKMKELENDSFKFAFTWIEGGRDKGWVTHYRSKHPPASLMVQSAMQFLGLKTFDSCPEFDFDSCYWSFRPYPGEAEPFAADNAHQMFNVLPANFSTGIEKLIAVHTTVEPFGLNFMPVTRNATERQNIEVRNRIMSPIKPVNPALPDTFDVAFSFAGTNRKEAEAIAKIVRDAGFSVFYDDFYPEALWGKNLIELFDEIYRKKSRFCVMFVSAEYRDRLWTNHERQSAQSRALQQRGNDYILPIQVEDIELPGLSSVAYLPLSRYSVEQIADMLIARLKA